MKHLVIIGAGGFGKDVYYFAKNSIGYMEAFDIKGFLDPDIHSFDMFDNMPPIIGEENSYVIEKDDVFITALGDNKLRQKVVETLSSKGGTFISLLHKTAVVHEDARIGAGCLIQPYAFLGSNSYIGSHTYIQNNSVIGHDVNIGSFCRIDCNVVFVGGTQSDDFVTVHTSSVINHRVSIGRGAVVGACSFVIKNVKEDTTVIGNPARKLILY